MIINLDEKAKEIGLKPAFVKMLFDSFLQESTQILSELSSAVADNDLKKIESSAHSVKGSCGNLQLNEMYELARSIELAAKEGNSGFDYASSSQRLQTMLNELEVAQ